MAVSAYSTAQQGKTENKRLEGAARADLYNAQVARERADVEKQAYNQREEQIRREGRTALGKIRAGLAQSGAGYGTGTALDVERESMINAELDALNIRYEGELRSKALLQEAGLYEISAAENIEAGQQARKAGYIGAAGKVLSGLGYMYGRG
jgi:hypothetical protein